MLLAFALFWIVGLYLGTLISLPLEAAVSFGAIPIFGMLLWPRQRRSAIGGICILLVLFGAWYADMRRPQAGPNPIHLWNDQATVQFRGVVTEPPVPRGGWVQLTITVEQLKEREEWKESSGRVLVLAPVFSSYGFGDLVEVTGKLQTPPTFPGFDYREYLTYEGIRSTSFSPNLRRIGENEVAAPLIWLWRARRTLADGLERALPEPQAALGQSVLLGIRSTLPQSLLAAFNATGTTHIIAISGYNVSLVAGLFLAFGARRLDRRWAFVLGVLVILAYGLLAGLGPPVVRAMIMGSLALLAWWTGRQTHALTALGVAAAAMLTLNPLLFWSVSFQLSFVATTGLVVLPPYLWQLPGFSRFWQQRQGHSSSFTDSLVRGLADGLVVTLAATIATLPLIAFTFHRISLVAPLANLLAVPSLPPSLVASALVSLIGAVLPPLGEAIGWIAWLPLTWMIAAVQGLAEVPWASVELRAFDVVFVWASYALIVWLAKPVFTLSASPPLTSSSRQHSPAPSRASFGARWLFGLSLTIGLVGAVLVWSLALTRPDGMLHVSVLDVGQGDALLIQTPSNRQILVDGGPSPALILQRLGERLPFWDRDLDLVVLTHPQADHLTGLVGVAARYRIVQVVENGFSVISSTYREWERRLEETGTPRSRAVVGQEIDLGDGVFLRVWHPAGVALEQGPERNMNNNSLVLQLSWEQVSFLLTGDIEETAQAEILSRGLARPSTVLKVPHHGARDGLSGAFLDSVRPALAVVSVGKDNPFGHPAQETLALLKGIPVLRTDSLGTIEFLSDGERIWVKTERGVPGGE